MKTVTNAEFYAFVATIKKVGERKPHLKVLTNGIELRYITAAKGVKTIVAVVSKVKGVSTYKIA